MTVLYLFDLDETLFEHDPVEHANFPNMGNSEWIKYNSTELFMKGRPIKGMIEFYNFIKGHTEEFIQEKYDRVIIMTARDRMDDYDTFISFLGRHNVYGEIIFAGANYHPKGAPFNKYMSIAKLLKENTDYDVVHLFDDSKENIEYMLALKHDFPWVEFYGHHFHKVNTFGKWEH